MRPKLIPQELSIKKPFFWGLASVGLCLIVVSIFWAKLPPQIPLFFSKPKGEVQLAQTLFIGLPLIISLVLLFINSAFAQMIPNYPLLKRMLALSGTVVCILAAITIVRILFLVI